VISAGALAALRVAATLTHSLPRLRTRIRVGSTVVLDVRATAPDQPPPHPSEPVVSPCAFRRAVVDAHQARRQGRPASLLDLDPDVDPGIDIGTPPGGTARPGGLYRVPLEDRWLWAFATTLDPDTAFDLGRPVVAEGLRSVDVAALGVRPDRGTGVSLAYAETVSSPGSPDEAALLDLLEGLMARWAAHELVASLGHGSHDRNRM
jgi:hypothetical protein